MAEPKKPISGILGRMREKVIDRKVTEAVRGKRFTRGRVGVSRVKSPKSDFKEKINPHKGAYGEKAYGTPMSKKAPLKKLKEK